MGGGEESLRLYSSSRFLAGGEVDAPYGLSSRLKEDGPGVITILRRLITILCTFGNAKRRFIPAGTMALIAVIPHHCKMRVVFPEGVHITILMTPNSESIISVSVVVVKR